MDAMPCECIALKLIEALYHRRVISEKTYRDAVQQLSSATS